MIQLKYTPPAQDPWQRLKRVFPMVIRKSLEQALEVGLEASRRRMAPGGGGPRIRSGRLARSMGWRIYQNGDTFIGEIYADAPYAGVQEYGTQIQAAKADYLKFRVQGRWVQAKRVEIPARPYLRPGRDAAAKALKTILAKNLAEMKL